MADIHETINDFVSQTTFDSIVEELDALQTEYNLNKRIQRDLLHLIELGEGFNPFDKLKLLDVLRDTLKRRRYIKDILRQVMLPHNFDDLMDHGRVTKGNYDLKKIETEFPNRKYALRSHLKSPVVKEFIDNTRNSDKKLSMITIPKTEKEVFKAICNQKRHSAND